MAKLSASTKIKKYNTGYKVKQYGATCMECGKKMGHGTTGVVVMSRPHSFTYYHPSCFKKRKANQYPGHMI
jgi:hypothetical protein